MENWEKAIEIEQFIRNYVPKGWKEAIHVFSFAPYVTEKDYITFEDAYKNGYLPLTIKQHKEDIFGRIINRFDKPYIISAIQEYFEQKEKL